MGSTKRLSQHEQEFAMHRIIVDRDKIRTMHAEGRSIRAIAAEVGISKSLVANILNTKQ